MRFLVALHRYVGTALCVLLLAWFVSGIILIYAGYPLLGEAEKLARAPALDSAAARVSPGEAYRRAGLRDRIEYARLGMLLDRPVWFFLTAGRGWITVAADDGQLLPQVDQATAESIARRFGAGATRLEYEGLFLSPDQWTIYSAWAPYRPSQDFSPFHKFSVDDAARTEISVLQSTGDVTQVTTRRERIWGYLGAVVHWIYPTTLRARHPGVWNDLLVWASAAGLVLCLSGLVLGVYFYRWRRHPGVAGSPYRGWMAWHHYAGLLFGLLACTWLFSGLLSMDPWGWSATESSPSDTHLDIVRGGPLELASFTVSPDAAGKTCSSAALEVKEIHLVQLAGAPYYLCIETPHRTTLVAADGRHSDPFEAFPADALVASARRIVPEADVSSSSLLQRYDAYYYPTWEDKLVNEGRKRLPVLRLEFDDPARTLIYIDPHSGAPLNAYDTSGRWYRWLFHGLHSLNLPGLYSSRPLWDLLVLPLLLGGTALAVTGTWIGVKWLRRKARLPGRPSRHRSRAALNQ